MALASDRIACVLFDQCVLERRRRTIHARLFALGRITIVNIAVGPKYRTVTSHKRAIAWNWDIGSEYDRDPDTQVEPGFFRAAEVERDSSDLVCRGAPSVLAKLAEGETQARTPHIRHVQ